MFTLIPSMHCVEATEQDVIAVQRSTSTVTVALPGMKAESLDALVCIIRENAGMGVYLVFQSSNKKVLVYTPQEAANKAGPCDGTMKEAVCFAASLGFTMESVDLNCSKALREVIIRNLRVFRTPQDVMNSVRDKKTAAKDECKDGKSESERRAMEQAEMARLALERLQKERSERERILAEKEEAEKSAAEHAEAARLALEEFEKERAERERLLAEKADAEKRAAEHAEVARAAMEKIEAERSTQEKLLREKAEAEQRAAEESARRTREQAETERIESVKVMEEKKAAEKLVAEAAAARRDELETALTAKKAAQAMKAEQAVKARLDWERAGADRIASEKLLAERITSERAASARAEACRLALGETEKERMAGEGILAEKAAAEQSAAERIEAARRAWEKAEAERVESEIMLAAKATAEQKATEELDAAKIALERAKAERAEVERVAAEKAELERCAEESAAAAELLLKEAEEEVLAQERRVAEVAIFEAAESGPVAVTEMKKGREAVSAATTHIEWHARELAEAAQLKRAIDEPGSADAVHAVQPEPVSPASFFGGADNSSSLFEDDGQDGAAVTFKIADSLAFIEFQREEEVSEIYRSLNMARVTLEGYPSQNCTAYLCAIERGGATRVQLAFFLSESNKTLIYEPEIQPVSPEELSRTVQGGVSFAEIVGFMMDRIACDGSNARAQTLAGSPVFRRRQGDFAR